MGGDSPRAGLAIALLLLLALAYNWSYLRLGFQADDLVFLDLTQQEPRPYSRWLGMWASEQVTTITNLWWFEGKSTGVFWRPLPSLLFEGMVRLFGEGGAPFHLFTILLHGLVAGTLFLLVRRLTGKPALALLAGLVFLSFEDHSMGVAVLTMMTDPLCVLFVNLALLAHAAWLAKRSRRLLVLSLALLVPAFLSKESAVLAPLGMVLMSLLMPADGDAEVAVAGAIGWRDRVGSLLRDRAAWAPPAAMMVAYLAIYRALGFGGLSSGMYLDPLSHPVRYLGRLVTDLPIMWLATLSPVPPSLTWFAPGLTAPFAVAGLLLFALWMAALWPLRRSGLVLWALAFYLLVLLPQMSAGASERALYFPAAAASILLAVLLTRVGFVRRRLAPERPRAPRWTRAGGWLALWLVLIPGALLSAAYPFAYSPSFERVGKDALTALPHIAARQPEHVVILNTPGSMHCFYLQPAIEHRAGRRLDVRVLSSMNGVVSVETGGGRELMLYADRPGWLTNPFAGMLRASGPPRLGREYREELFTATIRELTPDGSDAAAVSFRFEIPLADSTLLVLAWDGAVFRPLDVASLDKGERRVLADTSDVWGSMW